MSPRPSSPTSPTAKATMPATTTARTLGAPSPRKPGSALATKSGRTPPKGAKATPKTAAAMKAKKTKSSTTPVDQAKAQPKPSARPRSKGTGANREPTRLRPAPPLHVDPSAPEVNGEVLLRAEQCIALLQRRLIKPMSRGGPRGDLTLTQYHALSFLAARGQASVGELKDILGFAQSTTSVLVDKLARLGLVEKLRDRRDHRQASVVALPKGLRMVQRYRKNAERNLLALKSVLGHNAVVDVFTALERALVATAPLEDPRVTRAASEDSDEELAAHAAE